MKKLYIMTLALIFALVMIVPMAIPVTAAPDAKPVSWVNAAMTEKMDFPDFPYSTSSALTVKKLSDGTTIGHVESHDFANKENSVEMQTYVCDTFISSDFHDNVATFEAYSYCKQTGQTIKVRWLLIDNGEPGKGNDEVMVSIWLPDAGVPIPLWWPLLGPQDPTDPSFGVPVKITTGNIQVHMGS